MACSYVVARNKAETHYESFIHFLKGSALRNCRTMPRLTWYSVTLTQRQRRRAWEDQAVIGVMLPEAKEDCGHGSCKRQGLSLRPSGRSMALLALCRPLLSEPRENRTPAALSQLAVLLCYCRPQKLRLNSLMLSHCSRKSQFSSVQTLNCVHLFATPWTAACQTLCGPMDQSPPGSSVHGILQARILEWAAISSSRGSSRPRARTRGSCVSCIGR